MDGTLAAIFFIAGLTDMALNDCPTGCLQLESNDARLFLQASGVEFDREIIGEELGIGYAFARSYGPFQPIVMATMTDQERFWVGAGALWTKPIVANSPIFVEASFMPGYDSGGAGPDIGGNLQFRSSLGLGYTFDGGATLALAYDHRSNADRLALNPGLETISLKLSILLD
ncbi:acyloxyacyl hydrolase [Yoonia sp. R2331]|uniref:acyloxyacyl hydrolase n=1 Tax=Yoonia sp. R2331 TaxID=3237238 RepID=UPI0034E5FE88